MPARRCTTARRATLPKLCQDRTCTRIFAGETARTCTPVRCSVFGVSGTRSARIGVRVLAAIGFGPRGETLTQARGARVLAGDPLLLVRIAREVVHLVGARSEIEDVLPVAFTDAELE